ncbi:MAG: NnrS family protein [Rhodocyclales bacterium]|nr:NnrS family protein [Rhodocyclales bacterium]
MPTLPLQEPHPSTPARPSLAAWLAMAFRPFYLLGALLTVLAVPYWAVTLRGAPALPGVWWHAHEMVWGFGGAIVVGFLHTAVASWTGQPPLGGVRLGVLVLLWLVARLAWFLGEGAFPAAAGAALAFLLLAAFWLARSVLAARNRRNYVVPLLLLLFAGFEAGFFCTVQGKLAGEPLAWLDAGVLWLAGMIFFLGMRVIAFFTSQALGQPQVPNPAWVQVDTVAGGFALAGSVALGAPAPLIAALAVTVASIALRQSRRWLHRMIWTNPMVWILHLGFALTAAGVLAYGLAAFAPAWRSAAVHLLTVGGIGSMTLGMMTRTALGHTGGHPNRTPRGLHSAFLVLLAAALLRELAAFPSVGGGMLHASAFAFALAHLLYLWRFVPRLVRPRPDGRPG